ncbi:MAG: polysaccharide biosynthesis C-terminal domain-containing protein [Actinobacteria bacterium]|nr:polysaccharide biosynthesis C-terminal domain-containing protein [Actinomycetota bacterium]
MREGPGNGGGEGGLAGALGIGGGEGARDHLTILSGTGQNIVGLGVFVVASFAMNVLIARAFGAGSPALGQITLATQLAFVVGAATRFGMDMAAVRRVAIETGRGEAGRARAIVRLAVQIAAAASLAVTAVAFLLAGPIADLVKAPHAAYRAAAVAVIFVAVTQVYLGGSRGLKIMRHTLYAYWVGQAVSWIAFTLAAWALLHRTVSVTVGAYAASWAFATMVAWFFWRKGSAKLLPVLPARPGEARELVRYGAPRAPAALLSQALFYADLFVLSVVLDKSSRFELSAYAASVRVAQALVLFLTAVSYMFSPFVADLHERDERERLNALFKSITRWTLAGTVPLLLLFFIAPEPVLKVFGNDYALGADWLRILLIGQIVNVSVGAAGFVLIMVGRTTWDLVVYASSFALDLLLAILLVPHLGPKGAAIAQAATLVVSNLFRLSLVWRFVRIQPYDRSYARLLLPAAIGGAVMLGVHSLLSGPRWALDLLGTGLLGALAYSIALLLLGLTTVERGAVMRVLQRARSGHAG